MKKTMIYHFLEEAYKLGYSPTAKDIADFDLLCREHTVAVRADGDIDTYLKANGLSFAMEDYSTADSLYYQEILQFYMDRAETDTN